MNNKRKGIPVLPTLEYLAPKLYVRIRNKQQCRSIQRLGDIWNIPKENYMEYNIEKRKKVNDERLFYQHEVMLFFQKLCYSNYKYILDDALTPIEEKQLKEFIDKKAQERKKKNDTIRITNKTLLP